MVNINTQFDELLDGLKNVKNIVDEYKQIGRDNLDDYQRGFLDGYEHVRLINLIIDKIEDIK